jgi:hypothetical protein
VLLGADRTRGLGHAGLRLLSEPGIGGVAEIELRLHDFNEHLRRVAPALAARIAGPNGGGTSFIPLTLRSDAILLDDDLLPAHQPTRSLLQRYRRLRADAPQVPDSLSERPVAVLQTVQQIGGWDGLSRLPRLRHGAVAPGSVWVYELRGPLDAAALAWLVALERDGIGELLAEGYGGVIVGHPLHLQKGGHPL